MENLRNIPSQEFVNIVFSTKNKERYQQRLNILLALAKKTEQETSLSFQRVVNLFRRFIMSITSFSPFSPFFRKIASAFFSIPVTTQRENFFKSLHGEIVATIYQEIPDEYKRLITPRQLSESLLASFISVSLPIESYLQIMEISTEDWNTTPPFFVCENR